MVCPACVTAAVVSNFSATVAGLAVLKMRFDATHRKVKSAPAPTKTRPRYLQGPVATKMSKPLALKGRDDDTDDD